MELNWGAAGSKRYETGASRGALYLPDLPGVAWPGLVAITEGVSGGENESLYFDGIKILDSPASDDFVATLEAFTYPEEFERCDGTASPFPGMKVFHQPRQTFGLSYRSRIGNDVLGLDYGHKLHLVYNVTASPSEKVRRTTGAEIETTNFSWELNAVPVPIAGCKPSAHIAFDSTEVDPEFLELLESILYGSDDADPRLPTPEEILEFLPEFNTPFLIQEAPVTGLADLVPGVGDLIPSGVEGLYLSAPTTRLSETAVPGIYELE